MKTKSLLPIVLLIVAILSFVACSSDNNGGTNNYKTAKLIYSENDTGWTVSPEKTNGKTGYFKEEIRIPATYEGKPVTAVSGAFYSNPDFPVADIYIPASVNKIELYFDDETPATLHYEGNLSDWCNCTFGDNVFENISEFYADNVLIFDKNGFVKDAFASVENINPLAFSYAASCADNPSALSFTNTKTIGEKAFYKAGVNSLTLGGNLVSIGDDAFLFTSLKSQSITFTKDDIFIGKKALNVGGIVGSYLLTASEYKVPDGITSIATGAFAETDFSSVSLPYTIKAISKGAFVTQHKNYNNNNYVEVNFRGANKYWFNIKTNGDFLEYGIVKLSYDLVSAGDIIWPEGATTIPPRTFTNTAALKTVKIPEGIKSIGELAFYGCDAMTEIRIPTSLETVSEGAFKNAKVNGAAYAASLNDFLKVTWNSDITAIVTDGFYFNGERLSGKIVLPEITSLGAGLFKQSEITEIVFPDTLLDIPPNCMENILTLSKVTFGKNTRTIGSSAFYGCKGLESVTIPESVKEIASKAFASTSLSEISLHEGLEALDECAFATTEIYEISIPSTVTRVYYPGGKYLKIYPDVNINEIGSEGLKNIEKLYVDIGNAVINPSAFAECKNLKELVIESAAAIHSYAFSNCYALEKITLSENLKQIGNYAFQRCSVQSIVIPDRVVEVGYCAFFGANDLMFVTLGKSLVSLDEDYSAFAGCDGILEIYDRSTMDFGAHMAAYNENIINVYKEGGESAIYTENNMKFIVGADSAILFAYDGNDTVLTLPSLVKGVPYTIIDGLFMGNTTINKVVIPSTLKKIPDEAFKNSAVTEVVISEGVEFIGNEAFASTKITSVSIPSTVNKIGDGAFKNNANLVTITFADDAMLDEIGQSAFAYTGIKEITLPNVSKTGRYCFAGCKDLAFLSVGTMRFDNNNTHGLTRILGYLFECGTAAGEGFVSIEQGYSSSNGWYTLTFNIPSALKTVEVRGAVFESGVDNCTMIEKLILRGGNSVDVYGLTGCSQEMTVYYEGDAAAWSNAYSGDFSGTVIFIEAGATVE